MTREEFQAIWQRASAELRRCATVSLADICSLLSGGALTKEESRRRMRVARADEARLHAALDQYDAAKRDVPPDWLPPGERDS